ncbi:MAG: hypothetical protein JWN92_2431, partial [Candidatus Acidoferrum typicum]|nr:hypothetical protein [Candidatus Acidoferrum typicum]
MERRMDFCNAAVSLAPTQLLDGAKKPTRCRRDGNAEDFR